MNIVNWIKRFMKKSEKHQLAETRESKREFEAQMQIYEARAAWQDMKGGY